MLLALLSGCHLFVSGDIETTCDDLPGCADGELTADTADTDSGATDTDTGTAATDCPDPEIWYADADTDGFGDAASTAEACEAPDGYVADNTDCDDADASAYPGAAEIWYDGVDQDCAGGDDYDQDGDGYQSPEAAGGDDCADTDPEVRPGQAEICGDGVDNNCDGSSNDCALDGGYSTAEANRAWYGEAGETIGQIGAFIGDMNFSGWEDFAMGVPYYVNSAGSQGLVYVVTDDTPAGALADVAFQIVGNSTFEAFGQSVAAAGDVDGDGAADLLVGAPYSPELESYAGRVYLFKGPMTRDLNADDAMGSYLGQTDNGYLGYSMLSQRGAGPDGSDMLAISEFGWEGGQGRVHLIPSDDAEFIGAIDDVTVGRLLGDSARELGAGFTLTSGDHNADGVPDLVVSGPGYYGNGSAAYVVYGPPVAGDVSLADADVIINSDVQYDYWGFDADMEGDVDGDGFDDLAVTAPYHDRDKDYDVGAVYLYSGGLDGVLDREDASAVILGEEENLAFGASVATGDTDGDGRADLLVGATQAQIGGRPRGAAYLMLAPLSGTLSSADASARVAGDEPNDNLGTLVDLSDVNGDSYADLLLGAPGWDLTKTTTVSNVGSVYIFLGQGL